MALNAQLLFKHRDDTGTCLVLDSPFIPHNTALKMPPGNSTRETISIGTHPFTLHNIRSYHLLISTRVSIPIYGLPKAVILQVKISGGIYLVLAHVAFS